MPCEIEGFSDRIKQLRKEKKITQKQAAAFLKIAERNYQRLEADGNPSVETLMKIAKLYSVSTDYLLGLSDNPVND